MKHTVNIIMIDKVESVEMCVLRELSACFKFSKGVGSNTLNELGN